MKSHHRPASPDNSPPGVPDVSIIVVNWNLRDFLRDCLDSIRSHACDIKVETIVVDNASGDGSGAMVAEDYPEVLLIQNDENVGFSRANNQAMARASGRYYFLLNNDAFLTAGALPELVSFMDEHPHVGICGPRVLNPDNTLQIRSKGRFPSISTALGHFFLPAVWQGREARPRGFYEFKDGMNSRQMDWVSGCALLARRDAVQDVGLLDADVFMYCEDVDWCYRMNRAGWQVCYIPSANVVHFMGQSMKKQTGRKVGAHRAGLIAFYTKHHGSLAGAVFRAVLLLGYGVQAAGWLLDAARGQGAGLNKIRRMMPRRGSGSGR